MNVLPLNTMLVVKSDPPVYLRVTAVREPLVECRVPEDLVYELTFCRKNGRSLNRKTYFSVENTDWRVREGAARVAS